MGDDAAGHKAEARDGCCAYVRTFVLFFFRPPPSDLRSAESPGGAGYPPVADAVYRHLIGRQAACGAMASPPPAPRGGGLR